MSVKIILAGALALAAGVPAAAVVIDFSDQPNGVVAGPLVYPEATFISDTGQFFIGAAGVDDEICTLTDAFACDAVLTVDFYDDPVNNLTFLANGDDSASTILTVEVFTTEGSVGQFNFGGFDGVSATFTLIDLSGFTDVTQIFVYSDDPAGLGYDTFTFDVGDTVVPEPSSWALMIAGFGLVGGALRRRAATPLSA